MDVDSRFFGRLGGRGDGAGVATPHHRVATPYALFGHGRCIVDRKARKCWFLAVRMRSRPAKRSET